MSTHSKGNHFRIGAIDLVVTESAREWDTVEVVTNRAEVRIANKEE